MRNGRASFLILGVLIGCGGGTVFGDLDAGDRDANGLPDVNVDLDANGLSDANVGLDASVQPDSDSDANVVEDARIGADVRACTSQENCGIEGRGNGLDDNCNGQVDEGCSQCLPGEARVCYTGPLDRLNVGVCRAGLFVCDSSPACEGSILPTTEVCNRADDDCDGIVDEGLAGCVRRLVCPSALSGRPLTSVQLDAAPFSSQGSSEIAFVVDCPSNIPTERCPRANGTTFYATQSGTYTVRATVRYPDNTVESCSWPYTVSGSGLRVELDWDLLSRADLDLHLVRWSPSSSSLNGENDCHYGNCRPDSNNPIQWNLNNSPLSACVDAPQGTGAQWSRLGYCRNPRLDADTNGLSGACTQQTDPTSSSYCTPENINLDNPPPGQVYRVVASHYSGIAQTARVNIFCNGAVRSSLSSSMPLASSMPTFPPAVGDDWYVADVAFDANGDCRVYPIDQISRGASGIGPPWSCTPSGSQCIP